MMGSVMVSDVIPQIGYHATPFRVRVLRPLPFMGANAKYVLACNLTRLMLEAGETIKELHARCPTVSTGTIDRIRRAEVSAGINNVADLAAAYGLQPWQILVPNMRADTPLEPQTAPERRVGDRRQRQT